MSHDYEHWARNAEDWIAWARAPDHDAFWAYRGQLLDFIGTGKGNAQRNKVFSHNEGKNDSIPVARPPASPVRA